MSEDKVKELQDSVDELLKLIAQDGRFVQANRATIQRVLDASNALNKVPS